MDIRHLKAFIAVFEERNITVAAQRLCVAQPTLSVTIRQLEDDLGVELFLRQARGVEVSEQARQLYPQACRMVAEAEALRLRFRQGQERVSLALGIEADIAPAQVEACVRLASQAVGGLQLTLLEGCDGDARLADEALRCEDELFLPLWEEAFVLTMATGSQPDGRWITCPHHPSHQRLMSLYGEGEQVGQAASLQQALAMVAAGLGAAWLPQSLVERHPGIYWQPSPGLALRRRVGLCLTSQALVLPALASLQQFLSGPASL
ncbi:LysR family transcriptional regulator [Pseudomonas guariconensis]|uniref:LysR family transcriptional regulator n=1 Tax=Pseudomonas TaxID=286 RepID=UPI001CE403F2|nr:MULTISPECIES: LysR family transcriptional regulator [Pseudomonas]MCO7637224.1 LysR family transcriptional regulator [Pseudomonas sp. S 311-6]MCO7517654.1 LysR family transcriptional regulator [Pseudomonas putida]MCO7567945.1 LysR family transcriptional regulator [Pseudomonas mosselii]MCO7608128.1 LysR family transcriptional regulator [Pseudomonas guariconensis]MCO7619385.1 LysR family transcriptional regulator [Pseudomonas guariconensis]